MTIVNARIKEDALSLLAELEELTGANRSSMIAALLDYLAVQKRDEIKDYILNHVVFYTRGFRIKKRKK